MGADENYADRLESAATAMLRSGERQIARRGALVLIALAEADPARADQLSGLLAHPDGGVRSAVVSSGIEITGSLLDARLHDPAPAVRAALAARGSRLPESAREFLLHDRHLAVRHALEVHADAPPGDVDPEQDCSSDEGSA